MLTKTQ